MERHINGTLQSAVDAMKYNEYDGTYNTSYNDQGDSKDYIFEMNLTYGFILVICFVGFFGNGTVIWLLGFRISRKAFTTYILNLAVADFAFLLSLEFYTFIIFTEPDYVIYNKLLWHGFLCGRMGETSAPEEEKRFHMQSFSMERHINETLQSASDAVTYDEYNETYNSSYNDQGDFQYKRFEKCIIHGFFLVICCMGILGNGTVIWLLGFRIRRKPFTTYILNLAVADFALLLSLEFYTFIFFADYIIDSVALYLLSFTYNTGQLLLTAISIDRCVSVLFPIWHRRVRPTHFSTTVCALIWVLCFLLGLIIYILEIIYSFPYWLSEKSQFLLTGLLCLPLMTISTVILFIKVCFKSNPRKRGRLLTVILLSLLFFLMLYFPLNAILIAISFVDLDTPFPLRYGFLCASLNSSVNPFLYFLVGRKKGGQSRESLMVILQRVLNEEENDRQEMDPPCSNALSNLS
ncbi:mas-related G-protein coupled receptor member H-like [Lacerta agilis]|uniref:mas-related G-protein coupled receptor member H-like n=1 Tax=Lacerta agilis TaxID=80427 RepID=UPI00141933FD|nr:mas-related G-protein coupled receptor member H-like [Lacerta agilis]